MLCQSLREEAFSEFIQPLSYFLPCSSTKCSTCSYLTISCLPPASCRLQLRGQPAEAQQALPAWTKLGTTGTARFKA
jgi:hypothetical protein